MPFFNNNSLCFDERIADTNFTKIQSSFVHGKTNEAQNTPFLNFS